MPRLSKYLAVFALIAATTATTAQAEPEQSPPESPARLSRDQLAAGWIQLFDGETLFGWRATSDANWRVEHGTIVVDAGEPGWLMSTVDWADYELHVEFKAPPETNSGVFLRSTSNPTDPARDCIEVNIAPRENPFPTASLVGRMRVSTTPQPLIDGYAAIHEGEIRTIGPPPQEIDAWDGRWHSFDIEAKGDKLRLKLDGRPLETQSLDVVDDASATPRRGRIGLQFREGAVAFRNVRLRPLRLEPIFNGRDLSGWNTDHAEASEFSVTPEGELHIVNGRGQIESDASYGDFVLQLECFVNGEGLNSGVFFRSIPREFTNGYESQINNVVVDGDPTKPADCGTGGIYRRVSARVVNARDRAWFAKTIVATGPAIAVWVDGLQTTAWTDDRPPHDNPRNGLRTAPGTLSLQGHDPTTDIRFRNLRIAELPPAK
ncbi:MAG: DUF1080 domain-containing protein [Pirellulales bacterium]|nr:DUF1080 domain-containing protein [Pirellulales bacterium]